MEDLAQGVGKVLQERNKGLLSALNRIDVPFAVNSLEELSLIDVTKYSSARLYYAIDRYEDFVYSPTDTTGKPSAGAGTWISLNSTPFNALVSEPLLFTGQTSNVFSLPYQVNMAMVQVDGEVLPASDDFYIINNDEANDGANPTLTIFADIYETTIVTVRVAMLTYTGALDTLKSFATVADMVSEFDAGSCITFEYNRPVVSFWRKVESGAGDMSDATLALVKGGYAKLQILPVMDVRAFGTHGDHDPDASTYVNDDSIRIANAIKNCGHVTCTPGDKFAMANNVPCNYDNKVIDLLPGSFYWFGVAGPVRQVGRDRAMFEIYGEFSGQFATSGPWSSWLEGAETFPADDTTDILSREFIILSVGALPNGPSESYMVRPMPVRATVSDPATRFQTDYRLGWTHDNATFRYAGITPIKNTILKLGHVEDKTTYEYDEEDVLGNRLSASATVMEAAWNCTVAINTSKNFQYPTVMTYYTSDCTVKDTFLLPSERVSLGIDGWGIIVQWNNAVRPKSYNLSAQGNRRVLDYTQCAYGYAENIGGESTRDGEMTTHGSYEHNLTYVNTRGFMSFANSGAEFGESTKDITVIHHHGSDIFAVTNVTNLSLKDCRCDSIRVNSVGLVMDNCSLYDLQTSVNNLCQINNWSAKIGKDYTPKNAVIENSQLGSNGLVFLVDQDIGADETITFANCEIELRQGDFAGPANIVFDNCQLKPKNGTGQLVLVANPTSIRFDNCKAKNIAFGIQAALTKPVNIIFDGGEYVGEAFGSAFWANEDDGTTTGNKIKLNDVTIDWDNSSSSGVFYDPLQPRNANWYTKIVDCDITGKNNETLRLPSLRGVLRFGNNTLTGINKDVDVNGTTRLEYNTIEL